MSQNLIQSTAPSTYLTPVSEVFSGIASPIDSTNLWGPKSQNSPSLRHRFRFEKTDDGEHDVVIESKAFFNDSTDYSYRIQPVLNLYYWVDILQLLPNWVDANKEATDTLKDIFDFYYQSAKRQIEQTLSSQITFHNALNVVEPSNSENK